MLESLLYRCFNYIAEWSNGNSLSSCAQKHRFNPCLCKLKSIISEVADHIKFDDLPLFVFPEPWRNVIADTYSATHKIRFLLFLAF